MVRRLREDGHLVAKDLAAELGTSEDTIRRDLRELTVVTHSPTIAVALVENRAVEVFLLSGRLSSTPS